MDSIMEFTNDFNYANIITHAGNFGPEDIFSIYLISLCTDNVVICRTNDIPTEDVHTGLSMNQVFFNIEYEPRFVVHLNYFSNLQDVWTFVGKPFFQQFDNASLVKCMERDIINIVINYSLPNSKRVLIRNIYQQFAFNLCEAISYASSQNTDNNIYRYTDFSNSVLFLGKKLCDFIDHF